jgi:hypothetical protein
MQRQVSRLRCDGTFSPQRRRFRLAVNGQKITRDCQTSWKFYRSLA